MNDMNRRNYFDKFMEKAVSRSIITGEQSGGLTTAWHRREKSSSIWGLHLLLCLLSIAGILIGLRYGILEVIDSGIFQSIFSHAARAARFVRNDFMQFFSMLRFKAGILFLAGLFANRVGGWLEKGRRTWLVRPVYVLGACLHGFAGVYLMMQGVIDRGWEELEVTSISFWCLIPLVMTLLGGFRPLFYQLLTGVIIAIHFLAFYYGVSGNIIVAFGVSTAVILISGAQFLAVREPRLALSIRYMAMTMICFILYCTGFVWDLPAILEFRGYIKPGAHHPTALFLIVLFTLSVALMAAAYFFKPGGRTAADGRFALLLLGTMLFAYFATGIIMEFISVGEIYDVFGGKFKQSIFTSNAILALVFSWVIWFLWCLWMLVESKATGRVILAQIGVTAMLGSIEIRYVEICRNFSFAAGLVMLPIALILAAVSVRILRKWLKDLLQDDGVPGAENLTTELMTE